jgi:hypothetical protein
MNHVIFEYCLLQSGTGYLESGVFLISSDGTQKKLHGKKELFTDVKLCLELNHLGRDGWEICGATTFVKGGNTFQTWTLKRRKGV